MRDRVNIQIIEDEINCDSSKINSNQPFDASIFTAIFSSLTTTKKKERRKKKLCARGEPHTIAVNKWTGMVVISREIIRIDLDFGLYLCVWTVNCPTAMIEKPIYWRWHTVCESERNRPDYTCWLRIKLHTFYGLTNDHIYIYIYVRCCDFLFYLLFFFLLIACLWFHCSSLSTNECQWWWRCLSTIHGATKILLSYTMSLQTSNHVFWFLVLLLPLLLLIVINDVITITRYQDTHLISLICSFKQWPCNSINKKKIYRYINALARKRKHRTILIAIQRNDRRVAWTEENSMNRK